jgi:exodeoxyribonuclease-3
MNIVCWNVNGLRANVKKGGFDWFLQKNPDLYCLQETKVHVDQLEDGVKNPDGYTGYFDHSRGRKGYSGVAVYTKVQPEKVEYGLGVEQFDQEGRFIGLFFKENAFGNGLPKFLLVNTYFPNGGGGPERLEYKLCFYDEFLKYINTQRKNGYEIIFCGDINTAHSEIDLARPKENEKNTGFLPVERAWIDQVINAGYIDIFRHLFPTLKDQYTYWDMKTFARERNVGWRIDYFFITPGLLKAVDKVRILKEIMGSDHCPIELILK